MSDTHRFDNGLRVERDLLIPLQLERYAVTNLHEPEEERWFARLCSAMTRAPIRFWDIGAGIGYYSLLVSRLCPGAMVDAFEPLPAHASAISRHWRLNDLDPGLLKVHRLAVSDSVGTAALDVKDFSSSLSGTAQDGALTVGTVTMDALLESSAGDIDLVKSDVQGAEDRVIGGAARHGGRVRNWIVGTHGAAKHDAVIAAFTARGLSIVHEAAVVAGQPDGIVIARNDR